MTDGLFYEFEPVSAKQWKQKIQFDLNGADYNDTLIWKTNEDISVKPFYNSEDLKNLSLHSFAQDSPWKIGQSIFVADVKKSNLNAIDAIKCGAESIKFIIPSEDIPIEGLVENIKSDNTLLYFELQFLSNSFIKKLSSFLPQAIVITDIIGNLSRTGNWFKSLNDDFSQFTSIVKQTKTCSVDLSLYQNAGATITQQLAYGLAHANEYLNHLDGKTSPFKINFNIAVGSNYFFEIAKLRALRLLYKTLASEYSVNINCDISTTPSKRNKTIYDYNTNMLRTTTECMSAILGGANTIINLPYDALYHKNNAFGDRISRNQLLILKNESYFNTVNNPADGTFYIESLAHQLAEKALELFKSIENQGGFLKQLKEGTIQRKIKESTTKEQNRFDEGKKVLIGTNKQPNPNDKMKDELQLYPFVKTKHRKTLIEPIIEKRLAENYEQNRLQNED
jgi:methylmalonyl-CoA mutase